MLAIKVYYNNGKITFIDALPERIKKARLTIIFEVEDEMDEISISGQEFTQKQRSSEEEFELIGLQSFFDTEDDKNVDWYEFFQLTENEKYNAANTKTT